MRQERKGTDREFIVYGLTLYNKVFYVGKTSIKLKDRLRIHKTTNKKVKNYCKGKINDIKIITLERCLNLTELHEREIFWINIFKSTNNDLLNYQYCTNRIIPKKYLLL